MFVEVDWRGTSNVSQNLFDVNDGSTVNRLMIFNSGGTALNMYIAAGTFPSAVDQGVSSTAFTGIQKIAFTYEKSASATCKLFVNGTLESTASNVDTDALTGLDEVLMGQSPTGSGVGEANMWIRAVALFTTRLSDAECEALTTI
jgi:hypothetical protein